MISLDEGWVGEAWSNKDRHGHMSTPMTLQRECGGRRCQVGPRPQEGLAMFEPESKVFFSPSDSR